MSKKTSVGRRLNPNVTGKTHKKISTGSKDDKFGLGYNDFVKLCKKVKKMKNLKGRRSVKQRTCHSYGPSSSRSA